MMKWILLAKKYISVSHRNKVNAHSDVRLATSLINFEFHTCGIFGGIEKNQEVEAIGTLIHLHNKQGCGK